MLQHSHAEQPAVRRHADEQPYRPRIPVRRDGLEHGCHRLACQPRAVHGQACVGAEQLGVTDLDPVGEQVVVVACVAEHAVERSRTACAFACRDAIARRVVHEREQYDGSSDSGGEGQGRAHHARAIRVSPGPVHRSVEW